MLWTSHGKRSCEPLTVSDADTCIGEAQVCAFAKLSAGIDEAEATELLQGCLDESEPDEDTSCSGASAVPDPDYGGDFDFLCDAVVVELQDFADLDTSCIDELDECMDDCTGLADGSDNDMSFAQCWDLGFNGTCPSFVKELDSCGGTVSEDSDEYCQLHCQATTGAWLDDLDDLCDLECL